MAVVRKWNPSVSFPTIVVNDTRCIIGFREDEIREALDI
jgi:glutaredoxin-like protein NrdH